MTNTSAAMHVELETSQVSLKKRRQSPKKPESELIRRFWDAPNEAFFSQDTIAAVTECKIKTLESQRWRGTGIAYRKVAGRVLYRKSDVISYLERHDLVMSTSEYKAEVAK